MHEVLVLKAALGSQLEKELEQLSLLLKLVPQLQVHGDDRVYGVSHLVRHACVNHLKHSFLLL